MRRALVWTWAASMAGCVTESGTASDTGGEGQMIGPAGGTVMSADGKLEIIIPPDAIAETTVVITESFEAPASIGEAYRVTPVTELALDATVIYHYDAEQAAGRDPANLNIAIDAGGFWESLERIGVDEGAMTVTCTDRALEFHYGLIEDGVGSADSTGSGSGSDSGTATGSETGMPTTDSGTTATGSSTGSATDSGTSTSTSTDSGTDSGSDSDSGSGSDTGMPDTCGNGVIDAGELCFLEGFSVSAGGGPTAIVAADFDGDNHEDFAVANGLDDTVSVRLGTGGGFFGAPSTINVGAGPSALHVVDLDGGGLDIIVANAAAGTVSILTGNGAGGFADGGTVAVGNGPTAVASGDFDGDMALDLVTANTATNDVSWLSAGMGPAVDFTVGGAANGLAVDDFNSDLNLDVVVANGDGSVSLLSGNGAGMFGLPSNTAIGGAATALAVGDFNGDADPDVAVASSGDVVTILLGNGVGGFGGGVPFATAAGPVAVGVADVNADNDLDVVVVNQAAGTVGVYAGNGAGNLAAAATFVVGTGPTAAAVADYNEDGRPDIVVTNEDDDSVSLLISDP